jgi:hypothetical protein
MEQEPWPPPQAAPEQSESAADPDAPESPVGTDLPQGQDPSQDQAPPEPEPAAPGALPVLTSGEPLTCAHPWCRGRIDPGSPYLQTRWGFMHQACAKRSFPLPS